MTTWDVTLQAHASTTVTVEADTFEDALAAAIEADTITVPYGANFEVTDTTAHSITADDGRTWTERRTFSENYFPDDAKSTGEPGTWYNLTTAIKEGVVIDWENLDGIAAECSDGSNGLTGTLTRNPGTEPATADAWKTQDDPVWDTALNLAWGGETKWELWIKLDTENNILSNTEKEA